MDIALLFLTCVVVLGVMTIQNHLSRADRRPDADVYAWTVRDPLPSIPIPLLPPDPDVRDLPAAGPDGAEESVRREAVGRLYAAIRRLPDADAALVLLYLDDMSYRQIAEVLGISEVNVGVKLNRAKKAIGELMKEEPRGS